MRRQFLSTYITVYLKPCLPLRLSENVYVPKLRGLSLADYIEARILFCQIEHSDRSHHNFLVCDCEPMLQVAIACTNKGYCKLSSAFKSNFPSLNYSPDIARRKFLQMPLASVKLSLGTEQQCAWYLFEYKEKTDYEQLTNIPSYLKNRPPNCTLNKSCVSSILSLAQSDREREVIRYSIFKASGLSRTAARRMFGFENIVERSDKVEDAIAEVQSIHETVEELAAIKNKAVCHTLGISTTSSSDSSSGTDITSELSDNDHVSVSTSEWSLNSIPINSLHDVAVQAKWNFFEIVAVLEDRFGIELEDDEILDSLCKTLENQVPSDCVKQLLEVSFKAFVAAKIAINPDERIAKMLNGEVVTDSESENECCYTGNYDFVNVKNLIEKRKKSIKRHFQLVKAKEINKRNFLSRKISRKVRGILKDFPDIGKEIEEFVSNRNVGADAWRRTGVLTFDGNQRINEKVTYDRIRRHLETKYGRSFAYGTVVQLCIPRNKRRRSAKNYKGVAKVTTRRARKGFSLKYNPDAHWSSAFYKGLNWLQYCDGSDIVNLNRDDAAGYRLDTLATHSQHPNPVVQGKPIVTTRTDYVNRHPSVLQTTSYNFAETPYSFEYCAGIVKAAKIYPKNPAQHFADLRMIQRTDLNAAFINPITNQKKRVECIRVDGAGDEGPSHLEVQYFWTKRHLEEGNLATLVTTRASGNSYLNRVELQNGCLALAHSNLFIPSSLKGSCYNNGEFSESKLIENLEAAIDVYIEHCNKAPCGNTKILLYKGADSSEFQKIRKQLSSFFKAKNKLKSENPSLYEQFDLIWSLRNRHMVKGLPSKYIFYLLPCYLPKCTHPICKNGKKSDEELWYPNGPPLTYLPLPIPDQNRPFGKKCNECSFCSGHYMNPKEAFLELSHNSISSIPLPPSEMIGQFFEMISNPTPDEIEQLSKKVLLPPNEVNIWLEHLAAVKRNRAKGTAKAMETKRRKKNLHVPQNSKATSDSFNSESESDKDDHHSLLVLDQRETNKRGAHGEALEQNDVDINSGTKSSKGLIGSRKGCESKHCSNAVYN